MRFLIIVTGYNCDKYVRKCYDSIMAQTYDNFRAVFISDGSTDETNKNIIDLRGVVHEIYRDNMGAAKRRYDAINRYGKQMDVVLLMGMDDELFPGCLERIKREYDRGAWVTYGNWTNQYGQGLPDSFALEFDEQTHAARDYRRVKYRSTAPNTFYKFLFDQFSEGDFMFNGEWIKATTESNLMISCLEMCGRDRIGPIHDAIYLYNQRDENARRRLGSEYQDAIYADVMSKPKRDLI